MQILCVRTHFLLWGNHTERLFKRSRGVPVFLREKTIVILTESDRHYILHDYIMVDHIQTWSFSNHLVTNTMSESFNWSIVISTVSSFSSPHQPAISVQWNSNDNTDFAYNRFHTTISVYHFQNPKCRKYNEGFPFILPSTTFKTHDIVFKRQTDG